MRKREKKFYTIEIQQSAYPLHCKKNIGSYLVHLDILEQRFLPMVHYQQIIQ